MNKPRYLEDVLTHDPLPDHGADVTIFSLVPPNNKNRRPLVRVYGEGNLIQDTTRRNNYVAAIAALPDLLEALEAIAQDFRCSDNAQWAREALTKAGYTF